MKNFLLSIFTTLSVFSSPTFANLACPVALQTQREVTKVNYDVVRMTSGPAARELYEKLNVSSVPIPDSLNLKNKNIISLKEISFFRGAFKIRVAKVARDEFNLEDITESEPLYYAQIILSRPTIIRDFQKRDVGVYTSDEKISINFGERHNLIKEDHGRDITEIFPDVGIRDGQCIGGICGNGKYFMKWIPFSHNSSSFNILLPFGSTEGIPSQAPRSQINVTVSNETFWGDVKKTLNWFFNSNS